MKYALTLALVVLALSVVAQANVVVGTYTGLLPNGQPGGITAVVTQVTDTADMPAAGLTAYIVTLNTAVGVYSADGRIDAVGNGFLHQAWGFFGGSPTPMVDMTAGTSYRKLTVAERLDDTHLLLTPTDIALTRAPAEDGVSDVDGNFIVTSGLSEGNGTTLAGPGFSATMAIGFTGATLNFNSLPFARVVLAGTDTAKFLFHISDSLKNDDAFDFTIGAVPEPMTLSLLGAGALALIRRRR